MTILFLLRVRGDTLHLWRFPHLIAAFFIGENEIDPQFGMCLEKRLCFVQAHHHKRGGISIGSDTICRQHVSSQQSVVGKVARLRQKLYP